MPPHKKQLSASDPDALVLSIEAAGRSASMTYDQAVRAWLDDGWTADQIVEASTRQAMAGRGPFAALYAGAEAAAYSASTSVAAVETAELLADGDMDQLGTWLTAGGAGTCDGCSALHGKQMTLAEFEALHGTNECGSRCYCYWVPEEVQPGSEQARFDRLMAETQPASILGSRGRAA